MSAVLKSTIIALILSMLPIQGDAKMHLSLLLTELLASTIVLVFLDRLYQRLFPFMNSKSHVTMYMYKTVWSNEIGGLIYNDLHDQVYEYIHILRSTNTTEYTGSIELIQNASKADSKIDIKVFNKEKKYTDIYNNVKYTVTIDTSCSSDKCLTIECGSTNNIPQYLEHIKKTVHVNKSKMITIYQLSNDTSYNNKAVVNGWEKINSVSRKTVKNTIYNSEITHDFFNDVKNFSENEQWYTDRALPYKKGYLLYGPPGTGKTSACKLIATMYNIPIFCLDLSMIFTNEALKNKCSAIQSIVPTGNYILLMEDIENSIFFKTTISEEEKSKQTHLTMDCLLNVLDGVNEPSGRITIITSNNPEVLFNTPALMRPGRVDKYIKFGYLGREEIEKMYEIFYEEKIDLGNNNIRTDITSAYLINILQECFNNRDKFLAKILYTK